MSASPSESESEPTTSTRFTNELRASAGDQWDRVIQHKFTKELAAGTIDMAVMQKFLIQDHRFLDAFIVLLSSAIAHARSLADRIPGCQFLALITGKENTYFERCFEKLNGCSVAERAAIPDASSTKDFCDLMREVALEGTLGEMLSVLVVCEWSYLSWGQLVEKDCIRDDFVFYEWVDLHTGETFEAVIAYLRGLLDQEGLLLDDEGRESCQKRFLQALQCEEEFFENAYSPF
jgi:thiaminase/transcriptional activator TenA